MRISREFFLKPSLSRREASYAAYGRLEENPDKKPAGDVFAARVDSIQSAPKGFRKTTFFSNSACHGPARNPLDAYRRGSEP
jgi:hypothetical protein